MSDLDGRSTVRQRAWLVLGLALVMVGCAGGRKQSLAPTPHFAVDDVESEIKAVRTTVSKGQVSNVEELDSTLIRLQKSVAGKPIEAEVNACLEKVFQLDTLMNSRPFPKDKALALLDELEKAVSAIKAKL
jgi:hypothetical protein